MLEKYKYPYLSIDHLKMGLIRSGNTALGPEDDDALTEYLWPIVREMIKTVHDAGFTTLRLPVSWHNHVSGEDFRINEPWLSRVQEVVDWALEEGMMVILNTHHDLDVNYYYPSSEHYDRSATYIRSIWEQLCERFGGYDERLIFESMNEPRLKDTPSEWVFNGAQADCQDAADCINRLNQLFVDTVRASGGHNAQRFLMVPGYAASPDGALTEHFSLPKDTVEHRLIVSVHAYTPYSFALQDGGESSFSTEAGAQTAEIGTFLNDLHRKFIAQGIPVVIGEFGARDKGGNTQARVDYAAWYAFSARARGIPCCWWDNGAVRGNGELFALLNRKDATWYYPEIVEALVRYGGNRE